MAVFRFLHISDLHIARQAARIGVLDFIKSGFSVNPLTGVAVASSHSPHLLDGLAEAVYREGDLFEGILITGDLATTGSQHDVTTAHSFVVSPYNPIAATPWHDANDNP